MAKTIKQRIALEGGQEFRAGLKSLGEEGQKAFENLRKTADDSAKSVGNIGERLADAEKVGRNFGSSLRDIADNAKAMASNLADAAKGIGVLGAAIFASTKATANAGDTQIKSAQAAGVAVDQYGRLTHAFEQAGVDASQSSNLFNRLNESIDGTSESAVKTRQAWQGLGVSAVRLGNGLVDTEKLIGDIAEKFKQMPDGANKSRLAIDLFGKRAGPQLIPFLNQGREGIKELGDEAERLGIVFNTKTAKSSERFNDTLDKLGKSFAGLRNSFATPFLEPFADAFNSLAETVASFRKPISDIATLVRDGLVGAFNVLRTTLGPIFTEISARLTQVLNLFNSIFGTKITAQHVVVVAAFAAITAIVVKLAAAVVTFLPIIGGLAKLFTGIPAIIAVVAGSLKLLGSLFLGIINAVRLLVFGFAGLSPVTLIILAVVAAVLLLIKYWPQVSAAAITAWNTIKNGAASAWKYVTDTWSSIVKFFTDLLSGEWLTKLWDSVKKTASDAWEWIKTKATEAFESIKSYLSKTWIGAVVEVIGKAIEKAKELARYVKQAFSGASASGGSSDGTAQGFARGGHVRGPGTGTSDSIWARLSNNEYVQPDRAVDYYGVGFMNMIRNLSFPRLDDLAAMLRMPVPAFADGGLVSVGAGASGGGNTLNLHFEGIGKLGPVTAGDDVVRAFTRAANRSIVSTAGRKPTWYR